MRYKRLDLAAKIFCIFTGMAFTAESLAFFTARRYHNNMPVYAIYSLLEFGIISLYFNYSIEAFRRKNIGIYIGITGIMIGICNIIFLQPINTLNSYFLFVEGIAIITMSLFSFFQLLLHEEGLKLYAYPHFWFPVALSFFWSITFLNWGLYDYFLAHIHEQVWIINLSILAVDIITYSTIGIVFFLYPKMKGDNHA